MNDQGDDGFVPIVLKRAKELYEEKVKTQEAEKLLSLSGEIENSSDSDDGHGK